MPCISYGLLYNDFYVHYCQIWLVNTLYQQEIVQLYDKGCIKSVALLANFELASTGLSLLSTDDQGSNSI